MKTKNVTKKLSLNKRTVSSLNRDDMMRLNGGRPWTDACDTLDICTSKISCPYETDNCWTIYADLCVSVDASCAC